MIGVELVRPGTGSPGEPAPPSWRAPCWRRRSGAGCWSARAACTANALRIAPPLSLTAQEAAEGLALLTASIEEAAAGLPPAASVEEEVVSP